jgi:mono/diheme cytochrome c family protein
LVAAVEDDRRKIVSAGAGDEQAFAAEARPPAATCGRREATAGIAAAFFRMMRDRMSPRTKWIPLSAALLALALMLSACGELKVQVAKSNPAHHGAELFAQRCAGCHTFTTAGTRGSASNIRTRERTDGPNFNVRRECVERVLYAIENGGFSGAIMPQNIVVGRDAQAVAQFVAEYAGKKAKGPRPQGTGSAANGYHCQSSGGTPGTRQSHGSSRNG